MEQGHIGIYSFSEKYPSFKTELDAKGWEFLNYFGTWKLRRKETQNEAI